MDSVSRRRFLEFASVGTVVGAAGCSDSTEPADSSASSSSNSSETSKAELQSRISELEDRVETLETEVSTKDQRIESLQQDLEALEEKANQQNQTIDSLESDLSEAEAKIEELEEESGEYQYGADVRETATSVGRTLREAVVVLDFELSGNYSSGGTGWFIDQNHIITNAHVVQDVVDGNTEAETGYLLDGTEFEFSVIDTAEDDDVALIETDAEAPYVPPRGAASSLTAGQPLVQVGNPSMIGNWVISLGEYVKEAEFSNAFHTEMPSTNGNSGSPVITLDGDVVGLTYGGVNRADVSGPPTPSDQGALEEYPYQTTQYGEHETIEVVEEYFQQWIDG